MRDDVAYPYSDVDWILKVGKKDKKKRKPFFTSNSAELLFEMVANGEGLVSCYEEMSLVKKHGLIKILPEIKGPEYREYIMSPKHTEKIKKLSVLKKFLLESIKK